MPENRKDLTAMADNNVYTASPSGKSGKTVGKIVAAVIIIFLLLIVVLNTFTTVDAGHSGVVTTFGKVSPNVLSEGLHTKIPFIQDIIQIDNRVLKAEVECSSASKDLQTVSSTIALNYRVRNESSADIYQNVGLDYESIIIAPAIHECVKAVTAKFTAEELITSRQAISDQMKEQLSEKISSYGIEVQIFNIISFDFTAEYNAAIEAKQTAQQNALKAEQDLQRVKVEAEQTVAKAQAEAEAYRLKSQELTPQMILMEYIDKWDGKLPSMVSGDGTSAMIDVTSLLEQFEAEQSSSDSKENESSYTASSETASSTETVSEEAEEASDTDEE